MAGTANSILIKEVCLIQSVLYREVPLYVTWMTIPSKLAACAHGGRGALVCLAPVSLQTRPHQSPSVEQGESLGVPAEEEPGPLEQCVGGGWGPAADKAGHSWE